MQLRQTRLTVMRDIHHKTLALEVLGQQARQGAVIVDNKDSGHGVRVSWPDSSGATTRTLPALRFFTLRQRTDT